MYSGAGTTDSGHVARGRPACNARLAAAAMPLAALDCEEAAMSTMVTELYDALRQAGVDETSARHAAEAVIGVAQGSTLATKGDLLAEMADLRVELADLRVELIKWNVGAMAALTAIFAAITRLP